MTSAGRFRWAAICALPAILLIIACDSPRPPELCGSIPEQTIVVGETVTADFCFDDPDGEILDLVVISSDPGVATAVATGTMVTVTAVSPGNALVTMIATDPTGLKAQQSFRVVVPNRAPTAVGMIADREVMVGDSATVEVAGYFSEPDGQVLAYAAAVSDSIRLTASVADAVVTVVAVAKGTVVVTVTATDPGGLAVVQSFQVKVPNRPPAAVDSIPSRIIEVARADTLDVSGYFADPDGDTLSYAAAVSDSGVVRAAVSGSAVTVTGLAKGDAIVTVTATDNEGLSATQSFRVTVPNRPPLITDSIPSRMLFKDEADTLDLAGYFADPDGDELTWGAEVSDSGVVAVAVSAGGGILTVTAVAQGEATGTVTATDTEGLAARQSFSVTVTNRGPVVTDTIPAQTLYKRETVPLDLTRHFRDPDGDPLDYVVETTDSMVVTATVAGTTLNVMAGAKGEATLTVTATDPGGLSARQSLKVTVLNRAPTATTPIPTRTIVLRQSDTVDVSLHFADPDGDSLTYTAATSARGVVRVTVAGTRVILRGVSRGAAEVTVTATDTDGATAEQTFAVIVANRTPVPVGKFPELTIARNERLTLPISGYFDDPDRDALTYSGTTSDSGIARATTSGSSVTLTGVAEGQTTVTLTATDPDGLTATQTARLTVAGESGGTPSRVGSISDQTIAQGRARTLVVSGYFQDPNGDPLRYSATTFDDEVATASVSGARVTVRGVATGQTTLTVTATDPDDLSTTQTSLVRVVARGRGPIAVGSIPEQTIEVGQVRTLSAPDHFQDPDGGNMSYAATASPSGVVTVRVSGDDLQLTGVSEGDATVTITATDSDGLSATQTAAVKVVRPGQRPVTVGSIPVQSISAGNLVAFDVEPYFRDPDGESLRYDGGTTDAAVATASASGSSVIVRGVSTGRTTLTVTATDPSGLSATQSTEVEVTAAPRGPEAIGTVPGESIDAGDELTIEMAPYFNDPNGNPLTYTAGTSNAGVATADMTGSTLAVKGQGGGAATITVVASDPNGRSAVQTFEVTVVRIDSGFNISVGFTPRVGAAVRGAVRSAAARWASILANTELPDIEVNGILTCASDNVIINVDIGTLDDLAVVADVRAVDGSGGTAAWAGLCDIRPSGLPALGLIVFDAADVDLLDQSGQLSTVTVHEMAHVLGFGILWGGLLQSPSRGDPGADTHFSGSNAVTAFNAAGGTSYTGGKVPVQNGGDDKHWRNAVMGDEIMAPTLSLSESEPLSAITIQSLADLGYRVNASLAQSYSLPSPDVVADIVGDVIELGDDVRQGPIMVIDRNGNVVEVIGEAPTTGLRPAGSVIRVVLREDR